MQIYFQQMLRKLRTSLENPLFIQKLQGMQCNFCNPENSNSIIEHQFLSLIEILRKLFINLFEVDIILSDECMEFLTATDNLAPQILKRECVKVMSKNLYLGSRTHFRKQYSLWIQSQSMTKFLRLQLEDWIEARQSFDHDKIMLWKFWYLSFVLKNNWFEIFDFDF